MPLAYLPVRSRRRALSSAWYSRDADAEVHQSAVLPGHEVAQAQVFQPQLVPEGGLHLHPAHIVPPGGGEHAGGPAPAGVGAQVLQHLRLAFESGHVLKVLQTQPLAVQRLYFGRQGAVLGLSPGHGAVPTIMENRVSTQRSLFFS